MLCCNVVILSLISRGQFFVHNHYVGMPYPAECPEKSYVKIFAHAIAVVFIALRVPPTARVLRHPVGQVMINKKGR
jgi:hypothetical protein